MRAGEALGLVRGQQTCDKILGAIVDCVKLFMIEREHTAFDLLIDLCLVITMEWQIATQNHVHDYTQTPTIALLAVVSVEHLGRQVVRRAHDSLELAILAVLLDYVLAQAKVNNFDAIVFGSIHNVLWLEVAMRNALTVEMIDC